MTESVWLAELAKAVPVLLGGALAILGGVGSQFLVHRLADQRDRAKLRREKLESLVKAVYAHGQWMEDRQRHTVFRNEAHDVPNPLAEAQMLQALYFPELAKELLAVQHAQISMLKAVNEQRVQQVESNLVSIVESSPDPFGDAYDQYLSARSALVKAARLLVEAR